MARQPTTSPGDFTGREKAKLAKENQTEQDEAAQSMALATARQTRDLDEVVDLTKKTSPPPQGRRETPPKQDEVVDMTSTKPKSAPAPRTTPTFVERDSVLVRARFDLEAVTIGNKPNPMDFEAGRRYRVTGPVAAHLSERDLVDVLD
jgi:hypothetical protein